MKKVVLFAALIAFTLILTPSQASAFSFSWPSFNFNFPFPSKPPVPTPPPLPVITKQIKVEGNYKKNKNIVELQFSNLDQVQSVSFALTYTHSGIPEGLMDGFTPNGLKRVKKEVFLGTCSTAVCKPHLNAKNIQLEVTGFYTNGQPFSKFLNIK